MAVKPADWYYCRENSCPLFYNCYPCNYSNYDEFIGRGTIIYCGGNIAFRDGDKWCNVPCACSCHDKKAFGRSDRQRDGLFYVWWRNGPDYWPSCDYRCCFVMGLGRDMETYPLWAIGLIHSLFPFAENKNLDRGLQKLAR